MNSTILCLAGATLHVALLPAAAHAQCVIFDRPEELFARADAVFLGTVVETEPTGAQGAHAIVQIATLRVERSWKGRPGRAVRVGADRPFETDRKYLVFAAGDPLSTTILCRWTEPEDRAKPRLEWLAQRARREELSGARKRWASHGIEEYEFTFQARCFCRQEFLRPVRFRVGEGGSVLLTKIDELAREYFEKYNTVEKLFEFVESAIDRNAYELNVTYDAELGYPRSADVDYERMMKDEELRFRVTEFTVIGKRMAGVSR